MRLLITLALLFGAPSLYAEATYHPKGNPVKANSFDWDLDGVFGETGTEDVICDGAGETDTNDVAVEDIDDDSTDEMQIYWDSSIAVTYDGQSAGDFTHQETVSWSGGTGFMLVDDSSGATGTLYVSLISGVAPTNDQVLTGGTSSVTADADGTAVVQGTDSLTCGTFTSPCATLDYAMNTRIDDAQTDNPSLGEVAICGFGTHDANMTIDTSISGDTGTRTVTAASQSSTSNQRYDHQFPTNPTRILSTDWDGDGEYMPRDTDDGGMILNWGGGYQINVEPNVGPSRVEWTHFLSIDAGIDNSANGGFFDVGSSAGSPTHWWIHDAQIDRTNFEKCKSTGNIMFSFFGWKIDYFVIESLYVTELYSYFSRGGMEASNVMFRRNYTTHAAIGGNDTDDRNGNNCQNGEVASGATSGGNIQRMWCPTTGDRNLDFIDNSFTVVRYDNPIGSGNNRIAAGMMLTGCRETNHSGNMVVDYSDLLFGLDTKDGIGADQSSEDQYRNHNNYVATETDAWHANKTSGVAGIVDAGSSHSFPEDILTGTMEWSNWCVDLTAITSTDIAEGFVTGGTASSDYDASTWNVNDNRYYANWGVSGAAIWFNSNTSAGTVAVPGTFNYNDNTIGSPGSPSGDKIINANAVDRATAWSDSNSGNTYYTDNFENNNSNVTGAANWATEMGHTAPTISSTGAPGCNVVADGVDYSGLGAGGALSFFLRF